MLEVPEAIILETATEVVPMLVAKPVAKPVALEDVPELTEASRASEEMMSRAAGCGCTWGFPPFVGAV